MADTEEMRRLIRHAATLAEIQIDLLRMALAARMGEEQPSATPEPAAEPYPDGVRRTQRTGGNR